MWLKIIQPICTTELKNDVIFWTCCWGAKKVLIGLVLIHRMGSNRFRCHYTKYAYNKRLQICIASAHFSMMRGAGPIMLQNMAFEEFDRSLISQFNWFFVTYLDGPCSFSTDKIPPIVLRTLICHHEGENYFRNDSPRQLL